MIKATKVDHESTFDIEIDGGKLYVWSGGFMQAQPLTETQARGLLHHLMELFPDEARLFVLGQSYLKEYKDLTS